MVDLSQGQELTEVDVDLHPSDLVLSADGRALYVANANSDIVSALDTESNKVVATLLVRPDPALPFGSAPRRDSMIVIDNNARVF